MNRNIRAILKKDLQTWAIAPNENQLDAILEDFFTAQDEVLEVVFRRVALHPDCSYCRYLEKYQPSHDGSSRCQSGSIASGGTKAHCTCDVCF